MEYKIGDRVRVLYGYKSGMDGIPGLSRMERMNGKILTIVDKTTNINNIDWFKVRENEFNWSEKMFEPISDTFSVKKKLNFPLL